MRGCARTGWSIRVWERLQLFQEVATSKKRISSNKESPAFTMGKFIQNMVCLQIKLLLLLMKDALQNKRKPKRMTLLWL